MSSSTSHKSPENDDDDDDNDDDDTDDDDDENQCDNRRIHLLKIIQITLMHSTEHSKLYSSCVGKLWRQFAHEKVPWNKLQN